MNKALLTGRITKDPEVRYTSTGIPTVSFSLAVDRGMKDASGQRIADFINCVAWRGQADFIGRYIKKGNMLGVEGRIQTRNYQGQDGITRYVTEIVVDQVESLTPRDPNASVNPGVNQNQNQYNNPTYGAQAQPTQNYNSYQQPNVKEGPKMPETFEVAEDDLPF